MRLLLDTHTLLWWFSDDSALPASCQGLIGQMKTEVFVSVVSAWEISTKFRLGKLSSAAEPVQDFGGYLARDNFHSLLLTPHHGIRAGLLPGPLKDPFDRMLIAQAQAEDLTIVSNEVSFDNYGVRRAWDKTPFAV